MLASSALRLHFACKGLLVLRSSSLEPCGALLGDYCFWDKHNTSNREHRKLNYALEGLSVPSLRWVGSFVVVLVRINRGGAVNLGVQPVKELAGSLVR